MHYTRPMWAVLSAIGLLLLVVGVGAAFQVIEGTTLTVLVRLLSFGAIGVLIWARRTQRGRR